LTGTTGLSSEQPAIKLTSATSAHEATTKLILPERIARLLSFGLPFPSPRALSGNDVYRVTSAEKP
jgi:hypothetical protein